MTNWTMMQKPDNELMSSFPSGDVRKYLGIVNGFPSGDPARWLLDSYQLINMNWPNTYGDYSFIVMPASKALESWIFKLAKDLDIEVSTNKAGVVRNQIENYLNTILDDIGKKLGDSIKNDVSHLKNIIQEYRNDIVHYQGKIESSALAKNKVIVIYDRINSVTEKLFSAGILK